MLLDTQKYLPPYEKQLYLEFLRQDVKQKGLIRNLIGKFFGQC